MKKQILLILTAIIITVNSFAQEKWTLEKCIRYAQENNIQVKQQKLSVKVSESRLIQSRGSLFPSVNGYASDSYRMGRSVDPYTNSFSNTNVNSINFGLQASVDLFKGMQQYKTLKANEYMLMASMQDLEIMKNNISLNVVAAYLQILFAEENLENAETQKEITEKQLSRTQKLVDAGSLAEGNLLEVQAQLASEELNVINAENKLSIAKLSLNQLLELKEQEIDIVKPLLPDLKTEAVAINPQMIFLEAMERPEIKASKYRVQSAESLLSNAKGAYSPSLRLSVSWGTGYSDARKKYDLQPSSPKTVGYLEQNPKMLVKAAGFSTVEKDYAFNLQIRDNASTTIGLTLNIPIFNKLRIREKVSREKFNLKNEKYKEELVKNQLFKDIQNAYNEAKTALSEYKGTQKSLEAQKEAFRHTEQKFQLGIVTSLDYVQAKTKLNTAESYLLKAKFKYLFATKVLDFYRGRPLTSIR